MNQVQMQQNVLGKAQVGGKLRSDLKFMLGVYDSNVQDNAFGPVLIYGVRQWYGATG